MTINENDLTNARTAWGESMIAISQAYKKKMRSQLYKKACVHSFIKKGCVHSFV